MPTYRYLGLTDEEKKRRVDDGVKLAFPAEIPGMPKQYTLDARDPPQRVEEKKAAVKKYKDKRRKELEMDVDILDRSTGVGGFTFPKGEPVEVPDEPENEYAIKKLEYACSCRGGSRFEKLNNTPKPPEEKRRGPGRPPKQE